jgi:hypothetical protein
MVVGAGCNTKKPQGQSQTGTGTEVIDFFGFEMTECDYIPESLIKKKEYIKLDESKTDFLFKTISKIKICDDRIFILDKWMKKLIVFDKNGKGIGLVGRVGQGPGEYVRIHEFDVDNQGNIFFIDGTTDRLFIYDKNLKFVSVKQMPFESSMLCCLPNKKLILGLSSWNEGENKSRKIAVTDTALITEQVYLEYDEYYDNRYEFGESGFANEGNKILYNKSINDFVYEFTEDGKPSNTYFFDFGKKKLPNEYKKDLENYRERFEDYCFLVNFAVITDKYIIGTVIIRVEFMNFIIDRTGKKLYIYKEASGLIGYYDNRIVSSIYPGKYEDIQATDLPEDVKKFVENENFVLCINTLK